MNVFSLLCVHQNNSVKKRRVVYAIKFSNSNFLINICEMAQQRSRFRNFIQSLIEVNIESVLVCNTKLVPANIANTEILQLFILLNEQYLESLRATRSIYLRSNVNWESSAAYTEDWN
ncbi:hypothetical protein T4B_8030 [Trichinella pseudospiralis]|uniref:Uncharacterized protein n=1 Tax=Trichinella pseudospiralis TaxID=6337 RepID=A0A0V1JZ67_TRIPS|nr:hypothetical protein T4B_8030 [Trichinella pseudospiralis]KRZ40250.1 hypothetical protein T4C_7520 [Trichinella pseudospiralis]